ncbi:unnamed protein product [Cunninghamella blakesleeana]
MVNLQMPASDESTKIQINNIPTESSKPLASMNQSSTQQTPSTTKIPTNDTYLSSILCSSSNNNNNNNNNNCNENNNNDNKSTSTTGNCKGTSDCTCYKCQRQRRRAGSRGHKHITEQIQQQPSINIEKPTTTTTTTATITSSTSSTSIAPSSISSLSSPSSPIPNPSPSVLTAIHQKPASLQRSPSSNNSLASTILSNTSSPTSEQPTTPTPSTVSRNGSFMLRKKPSIISYERHLPRPTYSEYDSIYRIQQANQYNNNNHNNNNDNNNNPSLKQYQDDSYQISWKDDTGDDILSSLKTFQTIFDEKPYDNNGLSDLIEIRAKEMQLQSLHEKEEEAILQQQLISSSNQKPPRRNDCVTLSYRNGPQHRHLTLYHTMKMKGPSERMGAYNKALQHCVNADSGLNAWLEKHSNQTSPSIINQNIRPNILFKKSTKRSILQLPGRKQKNIAEDLWLRTTKLTDESSPMVNHSNHNLTTSSTANENNVTPMDIISTANALMPASSTSAFNQPLNRSTINQKPYDHVDTPSKPNHRNSVDKESITSLDTENGRSQISGKIWSSLGRKSSRTRSATPSIHSIEKGHPLPNTIQEESDAFEKTLDDLCEVMANTNVDRSVLKKYLQHSNGDYMKTLSVIRSDVTSGKL